MRELGSIFIFAIAMPHNLIEPWSRQGFQPHAVAGFSEHDV